MSFIVILDGGVIRSASSSNFTAVGIKFGNNKKYTTSVNKFIPYEAVFLGVKYY